MSSLEIKVPAMGESIAEATVAAWHCQEGDQVNQGAVLVELETDKVTLEVPAPASGRITTIAAANGATVKVGDLLAKLEEGAGKPASVEKEEPQPPVGKSSPENLEAKPVPAPGPAARGILAEKSLKAEDVTGSGKHGQVTKGDALKAQAPLKRAAPADREKTVPMSRLRQKIAERLVEAQQTAAILTTFNEVDMSALMALRSRYKDAFKEKYAVGLGFMSFFVKACVNALREFPAVNAEIRGTDIVYKNYYDIGVAVGGPRGLVVPVVRDADLLTFAGIEAEIMRLAGKVKDGSIELAELTGGTFTISNGGVYGSMLSTPILNPPQSGILGMHNIVKRPVVVNDAIEIRPVMYLALSYDHRMIDGREAVTFLLRVKEAIEDPARLMLEV
ncbi:MAG: 2-oxoglutarate dehydrogenase complex dihydrolipoyllysine-residue succinyltransferase [Spirochaetales bacterium]|nr:2-oxoglutarate dehydrogenase complex dihydrolipoyllysine-residue succinyltransferase [Spirochaetales bacterium]